MKIKLKKKDALLLKAIVQNPFSDYETKEARKLRKRIFNQIGKPNKGFVKEEEIPF